MNPDDVKGIMKVGSSGTQPPAAGQKTAKFDELNVLATFHPEGKTYGHMVIDEPKTPFVFEKDLPKELDTAELIEKLRGTSLLTTPCFGMDQDSDDSSDDEDFPESVEEKVRRIVFERRRKLHYREFFSVPLARRLIAEEFGDMSESEPSYKSEPSSCVAETCPKDTNDTMMGEDEQLVDRTSHSLAHTESEDGGYNIEPEPGFDPSHPCYQKLMAEINRPATAETNKALDNASHGKPVRVPDPSSETDPKKSQSGSTL